MLEIFDSLYGKCCIYQDYKYENNNFYGIKIYNMGFIKQKKKLYSCKTLNSLKDFKIGGFFKSIKIICYIESKNKIKDFSYNQIWYKEKGNKYLEFICSYKF